MGKRLSFETIEPVSQYRPAMPVPVISISHLGKRYGSTVAVDDVSLEIHQGEIFGLIGPNGAGKTTTMECARS